MLIIIYSGNHISLGLVKGSPFLPFQTILAFFRWSILIKRLSPHTIIDSRARRSTIRELFSYTFYLQSKSKKVFTSAIDQIWKSISLVLECYLDTYIKN